MLGDVETRPTWVITERRASPSLASARVIGEPEAVMTARSPGRGLWRSACRQPGRGRVHPGVADTPLPHAGLNVADVAHVLILAKQRLITLRSGAVPVFGCCWKSMPSPPTSPLRPVVRGPYNCRERFFAGRARRPVPLPSGCLPDPAATSQDDLRSPRLAGSPFGEVTVATRPPPRRKRTAAVILAPCCPRGTGLRRDSARPRSPSSRRQAAAWPCQSQASRGPRR